MRTWVPPVACAPCWTHAVDPQPFGQHHSAGGRAPANQSLVNVITAMRAVLAIRSGGPLLLARQEGRACILATGLPRPLRHMARYALALIRMRGVFRRFLARDLRALRRFSRPSCTGPAAPAASSSRKLPFSNATARTGWRCWRACARGQRRSAILCCWTPSAAISAPLPAPMRTPIWGRRPGWNAMPSPSTPIWAWTRWSRF